MNKVVHRADSRGLAEHGWLTSRHTFSFAEYYDPERMHFGLLRVLNDDIVQAGRGFSTHPHDNMEIISIPLSGALEHKDSMGTGSVIHTHDVQIMSAGTGVYHSEFNPSRTEEVNFLQIWVFPKVKDIQPRYDQETFHPESMKNRFQMLISPNEKDNALWINQDAWFYMGDFEKFHHVHYTMKKEGNGLYFFIVEGKVKIADELLNKRDGIGVWDTSDVSIETVDKSKILLMEVPMN